MNASDARDDETIGSSMGGDYAERKSRVTPRQLWEFRRRQQQAENEEEHPDELAMAQAEAEVAEPEEEEETIKMNTPDAEEKEPIKQQDAAAASEEQDQDLEVGEDLLDDLLDEPARTAEPRMVEPEKQPGLMRYPFATHGPAPGGLDDEAQQPEDQEEETQVMSIGKSERLVSSSFVVGALIILGVLLLGIIMAGQKSRIGALERRVADLETKVMFSEGSGSFESASR